MVAWHDSSKFVGSFGVILITTSFEFVFTYVVEQSIITKVRNAAN